MFSRLKQAVKWLLRPLADVLLASARTLPERVEACLGGSAALQEHVDKRLAVSDNVAKHIDHCIQNSEALWSRIEEHFQCSEALPDQIELWLKHSEVLPARIEGALVNSPMVLQVFEEHFASSAALWQRFDTFLASSSGVAKLLDSYLTNSPALVGWFEAQVAASPALAKRFESYLGTPGTLSKRLDKLLAGSGVVEQRLEEGLRDSKALTGRVEEYVASSALVTTRVEECLASSPALGERVEACVRDLRAVADRIEECLWSSRALPRRVDEHLAGSDALATALIEACLQRSGSLPRILSDLLPDNPVLAAVVHPTGAEYPVCVPRAMPGRLEMKGLPVPGRELWEGYGPTAADYLESGNEHVRKLREILAAAGAPLENATRMLDFTCGAGRALRWLTDLAESREIWGVDVSAPLVVWLRQTLCPPFHAAVRSTYPHLPFEDRYFDLIFSLVPFGRPHDLADAWLLELKRVLRPGGKLCLCVLDKPAVQRLLDPARPHSTGSETVARAALSAEPYQELLRSNYERLALPTPQGIQVLFDQDYLREEWGRQMRVLSVTPEAIGVCTVFLLERP